MILTNLVLTFRLSLSDVPSETSSHLKLMNNLLCKVLETGVLPTGIGVLHLIHREHGLIWCICRLGFKAEVPLLLFSLNILLFPFSLDRMIPLTCCNFTQYAETFEVTVQWSN